MASIEFSGDERDTLIGAAIWAPSMLNTQPWRFRLHGHRIEVHRDLMRELPASDPEQRMALISAGAVVFNVRVAAASLGYDVASTIEPGAENTLVAALTLTRRTSSGQPSLAVLHPFVATRRTNRQPFDASVVPTSIREQLSTAASSEGAVLEWIDDPNRRWWLLRLKTDADLDDAVDSDRIAERRKWVGGDRDRDGIPSRSLGPKAVRLSSPVRDLAADHADLRRPSARFEESADLALLSTSHDSRADWVVAGQALQHVLLVATSVGVSTSLLSEAMEHKDLRWLGRNPLGHWLEPQTMIRFGYGPQVPATPRRPVAEFMITD
ncbi:MAG: Acg family FMN-binding oxidoreductase [Jiangellaceae bacterium]